MLQNAWLTCRKTPSGVMTTRPTEVRSNASRTRSKSMRGWSRAIALIAVRSTHPCGAGRRLERGAADGCAEARPEPLRKRLEHVLLRREVDDLLGLDHLARDVVEPAQAVGQPQLHAFLAGPDEAREHLGRFLQPRSAPGAHHLDELLVDLGEHLLRVLLVRLVLRGERI